MGVVDEDGTYIAIGNKLVIASSIVKLLNIKRQEAGSKIKL